MRKTKERLVLNEKKLAIHKKEQEIKSELHEAITAHEQTGRQPATRKMVAYIMQKCAQQLLDIDGDDD